MRKKTSTAHNEHNIKQNKTQIKMSNIKHNTTQNTKHNKTQHMANNKTQQATLSSHHYF